MFRNLKFILQLFIALSFASPSFAKSKISQPTHKKMKASKEKGKLSGTKKIGPQLGSDLKMLKGFEIEILSYDKETRSYKVRSVKFPAEREPSVTLKALSISVKNLETYLIVRKPSMIVGKKYMLAKDLSTLTPEETLARKK